VLASVAFALALLEGGSYLAVWYLSRSPLTMSLFYTRPSVTRAEYEDYLRRRDPRLGWPPPEQIGGTAYDRSGSRPIPAFPQPGNECASLYGDSFTYGSDVDDADAWSNVLSRLLDCRVANFGVGGYGTDQAYLRFRYNTDDRAPVTILGYFPTDVLRNLTRNAYFAFGTFPTSFKPRFLFADRKLLLLGMPRVSVDQLQHFLDSPGDFLADDMLLPGTRYGPVPIRFPYFLTLARTALQPRVSSWLRGRPSWMEYLTPGHPSTGYEVLTGILDHFATLCRTRGKQCAVLLLPTPQSYRYYREHHTSALQTVTDALDARGIAYLDLAPAIAARLGSRPYCGLIAGAGSCAGHFNPRGNAMLAEIVRDYIVGKGWVRKAKPDAAARRGVGEDAGTATRGAG